MSYKEQDNAWVRPLRQHHLFVGAIYQWDNMEPLSAFIRPLEYEAQQYLEDSADLDPGALAQLIGPNCYRYRPSILAVEYYKIIHGCMLNLRLPSLINPRNNADRNVDVSLIQDEWHRDFRRRRRECVAGLYEKYKWPDLTNLIEKLY